MLHNLSNEGSVERKEGDTDEIVLRESFKPQMHIKADSRNQVSGLYEGVTENITESKAYLSNAPQIN